MLENKSINLLYLLVERLFTYFNISKCSRFKWLSILFSLHYKKII